MAEKIETEFTMNPSGFNAAIEKMTKAVLLLYGTMDTSGKAFEEHLEKVNEMYSKMSGKTKEAGKNAEGGSQSATKGMAGAVALGNVMFSALQKGFQKVVANIPEIARAFQVTGDIMMRNFLWPLRQFLMPYLNKMMQWARQNRPLFAQIGNVFLNGIKAAVQVATAIWQRLTAVIRGFMKGFGLSMSQITGSWERVLNMFIHKVATVMMYVEMLIAPILEFFGKVFGEHFKAMWEGLKVGLGDFDKNFVQPFQRLGAAIGAVVEKLLGMKQVQFIVDALKNAFITFGSVVGFAIGTAIRAIGSLADALATLIDPNKSWDDKIGALGKISTNFAEELKKSGAMEAEAIKKQWGKPEEAKPVKDLIVTDRGTFQPDPGDAIIALKKMNGGYKTGAAEAVQVSFGGITINVTASEGDAQRVGAAIAENIKRNLKTKLRDILYDDMALTGAA